jgi:hypothetical protein
MKSLRGKIILIVIIAIALLVSNPDLKKHQEKIVEKFKQENPISGFLGAGDLVKQIVAYDNYFFFSYGKISATNESVSFGIAGFVIVYKSLDLLKYKDMLPNQILPK